MGVTPRNSFSRETRTQDKADGQLQKRIFVNSLCAHSEGTRITSLKSYPKCEPSLSLHLLQALQPSSNLVQTLLRPQKDVNTRLGLLGTSLGLSPTAEQTSSGLTQGSGSGSQTSAFTQGSSGQTPTGRVPSGGEFTGSFSQCCCVPQ